MSVYHGDPRDFGPVHCCGDYRCPHGCACRPRVFEQPKQPHLDPIAAFTGGTIVRMPAEPARSLADDVDALARRFVEEHPDATHVEYVRNGWRVALTRPSDGSAFYVSMERA